MTQERLAHVLQDLRRLAGSLTVQALSDGQLLERFTATREEAAFAALVRRHGPLVLGVCRRILRHEQDAEDAFQATFLVLAHKAGSIRKGEAVSSWLHGVARRLALKARAQAVRRQARDRAAHGREPPGPASELDLRELQAILDEEVSRLPEKYRTPFVLCCLEGKSRPEAARELGWKEGTVSGRLAEARRRLQQRLTRRGVTLSAALCAAALSQTPLVLSAGLTVATVRAALLVAVGQMPAAGAVSVQAVALTRAALQTTAAAWFKITGACFLALAIVGGPAVLLFPALPKDTPVRNVALRSREPIRQPLAGRPRAPTRPGARPWPAAGVVMLAVSRDGKLLAGVGRNENLVRIWDTATGKELRQFHALATPVNAVAFTPDATLLAVGDDHDLHLWRTATGQDLYRLARGTVGSTTALAFTHGGKLLAAGGRDGRIRLWEVATGKLVCQASGHKAAVAALAFAGDDRLLATGDRDGTLWLWTVPDGRAVSQLTGRQDRVLCVALSPDGKILAWGSRNKPLRLWDRVSGRELWRGKQPGDVLAVAFAPDGKTLASGDGLGRVHLWEVATGQVVRQLGRHPGRVTGAAFSGDGKRLVTWGDGLRLAMWDTATGKELARFPDGPP